MLKINRNSADIAPEGSIDSHLGIIETFQRIQFSDTVAKFLDTSNGILAFSETCRAARDISSDSRKKYARQSLETALKHGNKKLCRVIIRSYPDFLAQNPILATIKCIGEDFVSEVVKSRPELLTPTVALKAAVYGSEDFVREIVTSRPELLLDSSTIVIDLSGKEIKGLTPLQAAICAGDVFMVRMMFEVLTQTTAPDLDQGQYEDQDFLDMSYQRSVREERIKIQKLSFNPWDEIQRQFSAIYPDSIDSVEAAQQALAQEFKTSKLNDIFTAINTVTEIDIQSELKNPGQINDASGPLNVALRDFREQFAHTSNLELIFNPYYLLKAIEFYKEQFNNFNCRNRRDLFWRQVIGYIQRHLPAYYLQAFATSMPGILYYHQANLERNFKFLFPYPLDDRLNNNLGYEYALETRSGQKIAGGLSIDCVTELHQDFRSLLKMKTVFWNLLCQKRHSCKNLI